MKDILKNLIGSVLGAVIIAALGLHQYRVIVDSPAPAASPLPAKQFEAVKPQPEPVPTVVTAPITPISVEPQTPVEAPTQMNNTPSPELSEPVKPVQPVTRDEPAANSQPPADANSSWRRFGDTGGTGTTSGLSAQPQQQYPPATSQQYVAPEQQYVAPSYQQYVAPSYQSYGAASPQYPVVVPIVPGYGYRQPTYRRPYLPSWGNRPRPQPYHQQAPMQRYYAPGNGARRR